MTLKSEEIQTLSLAWDAALHMGLFLALPPTPVFGALGTLLFQFTASCFGTCRLSLILSICFSRVQVSLSIFNVQSLASHSSPRGGSLERVKEKLQK